MGIYLLTYLLILFFIYSLIYLFYIYLSWYLFILISSLTTYMIYFRSLSISIYFFLLLRVYVTSITPTQHETQSADPIICVCVCCRLKSRDWPGDRFLLDVLAQM